MTIHTDPAVAVPNACVRCDGFHGKPMPLRDLPNSRPLCGVCALAIVSTAQSADEARLALHQFNAAQPTLAGDR